MDGWHGSLKLLLIVQFTERFSSSIISPILALFIRGHGITVSELGYIGTAGMFGWLIFEPIMGIIADRIRKKFLLVFSVLASSLIYMVYPLAGSFLHFSILAFAMSSVMSAYAVAVKALAAELLPASGRGKIYGRYVSVISIGGIIGPFLGGYLTEAFSQYMAFRVSAGAGAIGLAAAFLIRYDEKRIRETSQEEAITVKRSLFTKAFTVLLAIRMLYLFNHVFTQNFLPVFLHENTRIEASETEIGLYLGVMQFTSAASQAFIGDVTEKIGSREIIASSLIMSGVSYLGLLKISGDISLILLGALQGLVFAAADLSMMLHLMDIMPMDRTGVVMGIYSESENVGGMIAAPSLGVIYDAVGPASSVISVSAILIINGFLPLILVRDEKSG